MQGGSDDEEEDEDSEDEAPVAKGKRKALDPKGKKVLPPPVKKPRKSTLSRRSHLAPLTIVAEGPRVEVEYEEETETLSAQQMTSW